MREREFEVQNKHLKFRLDAFSINTSKIGSSTDQIYFDECVPLLACSKSHDWFPIKKTRATPK